MWHLIVVMSFYIQLTHGTAYLFLPPPWGLPNPKIIILEIQNMNACQKSFKLMPNPISYS